MSQNIEVLIDEEATDENAPPATVENRVVYQLDDVTRDTEAKANEVFDRLDVIANAMQEVDTYATLLNQTLQETMTAFGKLAARFENVPSFTAHHAQNLKALELLSLLRESTDSINNTIMETMDIMQYTDMHRQKIERVINVMRALSNYMNNLLSAKVDDTVRVKQSLHTDDSASDEEIEALIAALSQKG